MLSLGYLKRSLTVVISAAFVQLSASPFPMGPIAQDVNDGTPDVYDAVNLILGTSYAGNDEITHLFVEPDYVWQTTSDRSQLALIGMTAGYTNSIGIYTDPGTGLQTQSPLLTSGNFFGFKGFGTQANPFYESAFLNLSTGTQFGWYLDVNVAGAPDDPVNPRRTYYSEPELNTTDEGWDHLMTFDLRAANGTTIWLNNGEYTLNNAYLLAWEDLYNNHPLWWDWDYDDMMYIVGEVSPVVVPEPGTMALLGLGFLSLAFFRRSRQKSD